jgi:hypothetical protein
VVYKGFEAAVAAGFDAETAVERELVLRLASPDGTMILYNQIKRNLEHVCDFFQSCGCSLSPSAFQV